MYLVYLQSRMQQNIPFFMFLFQNMYKFNSVHYSVWKFMYISLPALNPSKRKKLNIYYLYWVMKLCSWSKPHSRETCSFIHLTLILGCITWITVKALCNFYKSEMFFTIQHHHFPFKGNTVALLRSLLSKTFCEISFHTILV